MHCDSHVKVRLPFWLKTETETDVSHALLAACDPHMCCKPLSKLLLHVLMSEWSDVASRQQRRYEKKPQGRRAQSGLRAPESQCTACKTRSFLSRDTCRGCGKQRDVKHDECINEWVTDRGLATTGWRSLRRCCLPCEQAERGSPGSCILPSARLCKMQETVAQRTFPARPGTLSGLSYQDRGSKLDRPCAS